MKSTIKIDYDRNQELKPVIKIILPLDLREGEMCSEAHDIDPRDKLIADFLHTPRNIVENYLFEVNQRLLINNGESLLTTIAAIPEESIFTRLKTAIIGRLVGDDSMQECQDMRGKTNRPCPHNYDKWLKITEFFEWVEEQPYSGNIDVPLVTIRSVFESRLTDEERMAAFNNTPKYKWDIGAENAYQALNQAFDFKTSPEGYEYWNKVLEGLK